MALLSMRSLTSVPSPAAAIDNMAELSRGTTEAAINRARRDLVAVELGAIDDRRAARARDTQPWIRELLLERATWKDAQARRLRADLQRLLAGGPLSRSAS